MSYRYMYYSPRGFANEFEIIRVAPDQVSDAEDIIRDAEAGANMQAWWLNRRHAERILAGERALTKEYKRAGLNLHQNPVGATEFTDFEPYSLPLSEHAQAMNAYRAGLAAYAEALAARDKTEAATDKAEGWYDWARSRMRRPGRAAEKEKSI